VRKVLEEWGSNVESLVLELGVESTDESLNLNVIQARISETENVLRLFIESANSRMGGLDCVLDCSSLGRAIERCPRSSNCLAVFG